MHITMGLLCSTFLILGSLSRCLLSSYFAALLPPSPYFSSGYDGLIKQVPIKYNENMFQNMKTCIMKSLVLKMSVS